MSDSNMVPSWAADMPEAVQEIAKKHPDNPEAAFTELAGAHASLHTKLGEQGTRIGELQEQLGKTPPPQGDHETKTYDSTDDIITAAGLDKAKLLDAYQSNGTLADEHYDALAKLGFNKMVVDAFIGGETAQAKLSQMDQDRLVGVAYQVAGGEEQYANKIEWMKQNLTPAELASYDELVSGPKATEVTIRQGVEWMNARFAAANGTPGGQVGATSLATGGAGAGAGAFSSREEAQQAMNDDRYHQTQVGGGQNPKYDPAYRRAVDARLLATARKGT